MTAYVLSLQPPAVCWHPMESIQAKNYENIDIFLLIFTIYSNILVHGYSDWILLSSMHSIYDDSRCFATLNCQLCAGMHVESTQAKNY